MKIYTFWSMPIKNKKMFFINLGISFIAKIVIYFLPYRRLSLYFGNRCQMLNASVLLNKSQIQEALVIKRSISLAVRYTPWNSNCLNQALMAIFWCKKYKIPYLIFIGLPKINRLPQKEIAHAWITAGPVVISGGNCFDSHHVLCSYSNILYDLKN